MKLLLDTHIWVWSLVDPGQLSRRVQRALKNAKNELWLSPISVWEVLMLAKKGRLVFDEPAERWVGRALEAAPLREAPLTHEVALASARMTGAPSDPADGFLVATAKVYGLTLVTADRRLEQLEEISVLTNRF